MTFTELQKNYLEHIKKEEKVWKDLEERLYREYIKSGYYPQWAEIKAKKEVLSLRSKPKNPVTMTIPIEQTKQGDLD